MQKQFYITGAIQRQIKTISAQVKGSAHIFAVIRMVADQNRCESLADAAKETGRWPHITMNDRVSAVVHLQLQQYQVACGRSQYIAFGGDLDELIELLPVKYAHFIHRQRILCNR